jgi:hypothetical protein
LGFPAAAVDLSVGPVIGLGFDNHGNPVFRDEPREFTQAFGARGQYQEPCSEQNLRAALSSATILELSCHGNGRNLTSDAELILRLETPGSGYRDISLLEICPRLVTPKLVILSACYSGVYNMAGGDFPVGGGPFLLQHGVQFCMVMRFAARADFARNLVVRFGQLLAGGAAVEAAFADSLRQMEAHGADLWRDLACVELLAAR